MPRCSTSAAARRGAAVGSDQWGVGFALAASAGEPGARRNDPPGWGTGVHVEPIRPVSDGAIFNRRYRNLFSTYRTRVRRRRWRCARCVRTTAVKVLHTQRAYSDNAQESASVCDLAPRCSRSAVDGRPAHRRKGARAALGHRGEPSCRSGTGAGKSPVLPEG